MGRAPCCDKANVKKGPWSPDEDSKLKSYIEQHGTGGNWIALPQKIGLKRCGKSCRLRWLNYLRPNIIHGGFTEEEDHIICSLYIAIGSRWSIIAAQLPGRTDNDIKNYWNTRLKKKLLGRQRKDHQSARRVLTPKQELNKIESIPLMVDDVGNHNPQWPQSMLNCEFNGNDEAIRKLLINLDRHYDSWVDQVAPSAHTNYLVEGCSSSQGQSGFQPFELDEVLYCNSMRSDELDCFYRPQNVIEENNAALSWIDEFPSINPTIASTYQVM